MRTLYEREGVVLKQWNEHDPKGITTEFHYGHFIISVAVGIEHDGWVGQSVAIMMDDAIIWRDDIANADAIATAFNMVRQLNEQLKPGKSPEED